MYTITMWQFEGLKDKYPYYKQEYRKMDRDIKVSEDENEEIK